MRATNISGGSRILKRGVPVQSYLNYLKLWDLQVIESVDSLSRDGADAQYMQYLSKTGPYDYTTNMLKA